MSAFFYQSIQIPRIVHILIEPTYRKKQDHRLLTCKLSANGNG